MKKAYTTTRNYNVIKSWYRCVGWISFNIILSFSSNIPTSPAYGVFISQLKRYARACSSYGCFILRATRLSNKLLEKGYVKERLKSSLRKFSGRYGDLIKQYEVSLSQMLNDILWPDHIQWQPPTDQILYRTRPFTEFWVVSIEHLRRVWHADRGRLLLRTPGPVPLGLAYVLLVNRGHLLIMDSLPTKFEVSGAKSSWVISCTRCETIMTLTLILLEVFASVMTVSAYFPDNNRTTKILN